MTNTTDPTQSMAIPDKKTLNQHLLIGERGTVEDVRVHSGYPNLEPNWHLDVCWLPR